MEIIQASNTSDAKQIAKIHIRSFPGFFLTFLGEGFLSYLYAGFIQHQDSGVLIARDGEQIFGFLAYSKDLSKFYSFLLKKYFFAFAWYGFLGTIRSPESIIRIFRALKYPSTSKRNEQYIEISSIAVDPATQTKGVGSQLISCLVEMFKDSGISIIRLETDAVGNDQINHFYQKNGFSLEQESVTPEGRKMNHYMKNIST